MSVHLKVNSANDQEPVFSTSICNECVLNINNFYTFKKRILEAQELISGLNLQNDYNEDGSECVEEDMVNPMLEIESENTADEADLHETEVKHQIAHSKSIVKTTNKKRTNESSGKTPNKKAKISTNNAEKVRIQMNECMICPAILSDILQLKDHIDKHTEIKCKQCNRQFARYSNLKRHFNSTHSKPKPFQCDLCGLGFFFSYNLQAHASIHYSGRIK